MINKNLSTNMAKLGQISERMLLVGSPPPPFEFYDYQQPIKRFRSNTSTDYDYRKLSLYGAPILIHEALMQYLVYQYFIQSEELAFVKYQDQLIIGDTLYTLTGYFLQEATFYSSSYKEIDRIDIVPSQEVVDLYHDITESQSISNIRGLPFFKWVKHEKEGKRSV
ncbi:MAG: hypothetical protein OXF84_08975, partial [Bacteroidetes bacterium]|nr:hypothetical protein [Bacteroidota bacterium]